MSLICSSSETNYFFLKIVFCLKNIHITKATKTWTVLLSVGPHMVEAGCFVHMQFAS